MSELHVSKENEVNEETIDIYISQSSEDDSEQGSSSYSYLSNIDNEDDFEATDSLATSSQVSLQDRDATCSMGMETLVRENFKKEVQEVIDCPISNTIPFTKMNSSGDVDSQRQFHETTDGMKIPESVTQDSISSFNSSSGKASSLTQNDIAGVSHTSDCKVDLQSFTPVEVQNTTSEKVELKKKHHRNRRRRNKTSNISTHESSVSKNKKTRSPTNLHKPNSSSTGSVHDSDQLRKPRVRRRSRKLRNNNSLNPIQATDSNLSGCFQDDKLSGYKVSTQHIVGRSQNDKSGAQEMPRLVDKYEAKCSVSLNGRYRSASESDIQPNIRKYERQYSDFTESCCRSPVLESKAQAKSRHGKNRKKTSSICETGCYTSVNESDTQQKMDEVKYETKFVEGYCISISESASLAKFRKKERKALMSIKGELNNVETPRQEKDFEECDFQGKVKQKKLHATNSSAVAEDNIKLVCGSDNQATLEQEENFKTLSTSETGQYKPEGESHAWEVLVEKCEAKPSASAVDSCTSAEETNALDKHMKKEKCERKYLDSDRVNVMQVSGSNNFHQQPINQEICPVDTVFSLQPSQLLNTEGVYNYMEADDDPKSSLASLNRKIQAMRLVCENDWKRDKAEFEESLKRISKKKKKKKVLLDEYESTKAEKENIEKSLKECDLLKETLLMFFVELEEDIEEQIHSDHHSSLVLHAYNKLQHKFDIECQRYEKRLPIYLWRSEILNTVNRCQTCVLIGETGSGKSTQVVQYLYEAGYAEHGIIACTQPRKLAARSLAEHVSKEAGEHGKSTYAYFGSDSKWKTGAKVVFMTDHTLLNECIADRRLSKYSVIVIDEAHERSIHTDILIALIKQCLPDRQDLRVIVTSATINPTLFSDYFGGYYECPIIEVPGRVYPVELNWVNKSFPVLERKYVEETVDLAYDVHLKHKGKEGDILVFLTSPAEIEQACRLAQATMKSEVTVLPLHGKLQPEEQQKVFEKTPGKRKVVFSTNVAETSVTIPGIKFVIDTGLSKEMCYDPQRNITSLEIRPISKSSANQRKGRAGRTGPGECHRLFSQQEYSDMRDDSTPEILRIALSFAVIKLYEFGIDEIHSFEFVDAPDRKALNDAVENLEFLGAITEGKLTKLGKKMALLPLEPNLSKVLLDSIDKGIGSIGAVAVSISSLAGQVFFRPSKDELQDVSDQLRLPFCQDSGDQMTNLHTYFQWYKQSKTDRSVWCKENYVNGKSMRMVREMVKELVQILKQKVRVNVSSSLESLANAEEILPKLYFDSFLKNLCIHLGHDKIGYWCEKYPTEQLVLHYGSSLHYLSSHPQCIIFERTQKTSQHFMLQVLPIPEEWIVSAIESGKLPCHPQHAPLFSLYRVSSLMISNLGPFVLSKLASKYPTDRRKSAEEFSELYVQPFFEYCKGKGEMKVIAQDIFHDKIRKSIQSFVDDIKKGLRSETCEGNLFDEHDNIRAVMAEGGVIQHVLLPNEFQGIRVSDLNCRFKEAAWKELQQYGECKLESGKCHDGMITLFIKFQDPSSASQALQHKFESIDDPNVVIYRMFERHRNDFCLKVTWPRRERRDFAYINLSEKQASLMTTTRPSVRDKISTLHFQYTEERKSIRVRGLLPDKNEEYIKSRLLLYYPFLTDIRVHFVFDKPFEETQESYSKQKLILEMKLSDIMARSKYVVDFPFPNNATKTKYIAYIQFDD